MVANMWSLLAFRESIIENLMKDFCLDSTSKDASDEFHYLELIPREEGKQKPKSRRCKLCYKSNVRKQTVYQCAVCLGNPSLCVIECFKHWHSMS